MRLGAVRLRLTGSPSARIAKSGHPGGGSSPSGKRGDLIKVLCVMATGCVCSPSARAARKNSKENQPSG